MGVATPHAAEAWFQCGHLLASQRGALVTSQRGHLLGVAKRAPRAGDLAILGVAISQVEERPELGIELYARRKLGTGGADVAGRHQLGALIEELNGARSSRRVLRRGFGRCPEDSDQDGRKTQ
jgi:hypothetical protein